MVAQQVPGGAVGEMLQRVGGVAADDAPQDGVGVLGRQRVFAGDLCRQTVRRGSLGMAVGLADARRVQQADSPTLSFRATKALLAAA